MNIFKNLFKRKNTQTIFSKPSDPKYFVDNKYGFINKKDLELLTDFASEYPNLYNSFCHKQGHKFSPGLRYIDPLKMDDYNIKKELPKY